MLVSLCIITYQRPEGLRRLLNGLNQLSFTTLEPPQIQVVVVDNEAAGGAIALCNELRPDFRWPLLCYEEPRRGISFARNRAIASAPDHSDWIAFIDDDEVPNPDWLEQLLRVQAAYHADVVHGPVLPHFQETAPNWVIQGKFFEPIRYFTGQPLKAAYTNNALVRADLLKNRPQPFEERFAMTGGEDSYFFRSLEQAGHKLVWADEAIVHEWIPPSRTTLRWLLQRGYRTCLSYSLWEREAQPSLQGRALSTFKAFGQILLGLLLLLPALLLPQQIRNRALLRISRGVGKLSGLLGLTYEEYRTVHGS